MKPAQLTSSVLMIRPVNFGYNLETAVSNVFQEAPQADEAALVQEKALNEFDVFVDRLRQAEVEVIVYNDTPSPFAPDSIFPNNWVTFHEDGRVVLYPMEAHNRRVERKINLIHSLEQDHGFYISEIVDLSYFEQEDKFLEGTGSMIIDRQNKIVYACNSSRTHADVLKVFCDLFDYNSLMFHAVDANKVPVYHTNVVMSVGENMVIICLEAILNEEEKNTISASLRASGKTIINITLQQMSTFAGNMLQVKNKQGQPVLVMSEQAYRALSNKQLNEIQQLTKVLYSDISTIEKYGGGSARCMMAEIFNKKNLKTASHEKSI